MKHRILVGIAGICMSLVMGCGAGVGGNTSSVAPSSEGTRAEEMTAGDKGVKEGAATFAEYEELIEDVSERIKSKDTDAPADDRFSSALIVSGYYADRVRGYLIQDIDGDGVEELIFGENGTDAEGVRGTIVYDIYTISGGELVHVLDGWVRNRYYLCENGMIANEGSNGADNSSYAYFTLENNALHLVESVICDGMRDAENPWFYSTKSEYDAENAEPVSEEKANEIMGKYVYLYPELIPFEDR